MIGIIYVLSNYYMHDSYGKPLYKIGLTERDDVGDRIKELTRGTGVPVEFEVVDSFEIETDNFKTIKELESWVHVALEEYRVNAKREFFILPKIDKVRHLITPFAKQIKDVSVNEEDLVEDLDSKEPKKEAKIEKERKKRTHFRFYKAEIPVDAIITFVRDENIKARVVDDINKIVRIDENGNDMGEAKAYTVLATEIWTSPPFNRDPDKTFPGADSWVYNGEILPNLRKDID